MARIRKLSDCEIKAAADRAEGIPDDVEAEAASEAVEHAPAEPAKPKGGRPPSYKPEYAAQAAMLCDLGATDQDLAKFFNTSITTVKNWKAKHPEFLSALKTGKGSADDRVERSLYQRAVGYSFDSEKVFQFQGAVIRAPVVEHVPPDTTAAIFWLKNRRQNEWRDVHKVEHGRAGEFDDKSVDELRKIVEEGAKKFAGVPFLKEMH